MPPASQSRGKNPPNPPRSPPPPSPDPTSAPSETPPLRRSHRIAAIASSAPSPLPPMHGTSASASPSPRLNARMSTGTAPGGAFLKRKPSSERAHSETESKRRRTPPQKGIRVGGNDNDNAQKEQVPSSSRGRDQHKGKGKEIVHDKSLRTSKSSARKRKKGKSIAIADSEPVQVSNSDLEMHRKLVQDAINILATSLFSKLQKEQQPQEREGEAGQAEEEVPYEFREQRDRAIQMAPEYARFAGKEEEETVKDDKPLPDGPGPFSEAMEVIKQRAAIFRDATAASSEQKNTARLTISWKPSTEAKGLFGTRAPSLQELTSKALLINAEELKYPVDKPLPFAIRNQISFMLCNARKMNMHHLTQLMEGNLVELRLSDCSWASKKNFEDAFGIRDKSKLEVLQLDRCGGCMPDRILKAFLACQPNSLPSLTKLSLKGAYSISDNGLKAIVSSARQLNSLNLCQCSLVTTEGIINAIEACLLKELYIDDCPKVNAMSILPSLKKLKCLEVLSMAGISSVSNNFVHDLISICGSTIMELNFANCNKLTSSSIKVIGEKCPNLAVLDIRNLTRIKDYAIAYLTNGCRTIRKLKLRNSSFSDEVIAAFVEASGSNLNELSLNMVAMVGHQTALAISQKCRANLRKLDLSFCRNMSDDALGIIVNSCYSLRTLKLFGCTQVTNEFLHNYSNPLVNILGVGGNLTEDIEIPHFL